MCRDDLKGNQRDYMDLYTVRVDILKVTCKHTILKQPGAAGH